MSAPLSLAISHSLGSVHVATWLESQRGEVTFPCGPEAAGNRVSPGFTYGSKNHDGSRVPRIGSTPSPLPLQRSSASYGPWRLGPRRVRGCPQSRFLYLNPRSPRVAGIRECSTRRFRASVIAPFGAVSFAQGRSGAGAHHCTSPISRFRASGGACRPGSCPGGSPRTHASYLMVSRVRGFVAAFDGCGAARRSLLRGQPTKARPLFQGSVLGALHGRAVRGQVLSPTGRAPPFVRVAGSPRTRSTY